MINDSNFGSFLCEVRMKKRIRLEQLSDGLCSVSMLSRIESGKREPEKLLKDTLLQRLGIIPENYENFLYYDVYKHWKQRQDIIHCILYNQIPKANQLLDHYYKTHDMMELLEEQFYLTMLGQIRSYEGADRRELKEIFQRAATLTIPNLDKRNLKKRILSVEELNLYLEYLYYCEGEGQIEKYEEVFDYIERIFVKRMQIDMFAMAKIYPKLVYYFLVAMGKRSVTDRTTAGRMLYLCNSAISVLQKSNRMFYFWELLGMKEKLLVYLIEVNKEIPGTKTDNLKKILEQCRAWRETLESVYEEYGVSKETKDFCYLYVDREVYCIGDVVRIRRKMFGMTMTELGTDICSERTISRLERNETEPQKEIVRELFGRLNMATELYKTDLITDNPEVLELFVEWKKQVNNREFEQGDRLLGQIKSLISLQIPENAQVLRRAEIISGFYKKSLSKEDYVKQLKEAIGYTIPYEMAIKLEEKYLTNSEISCIQNIVTKMDSSYSELNECVEMLYDLFENQKQIQDCLNMYEFVMRVVSNYLGSRGDYDTSDKINKKILSYALVNRRIKVIHQMIYDLFWNDEQRKKEQHPVQSGVDKKRELIKCIHFCEMSDNLHNMCFYRKKLKEE